MQQIAPGVHQVSKGVNAFIVDGDEGVVLVDTGLPRRHGAILGGLTSIGRSPQDVRAIVLTHAHADHAGGAAALKEATGAPLGVSPQDARVVRGEAPAPPPPILDFPVVSLLARLVPSAPPTTVEHEMTVGPVGIAPDLALIPTPGHTAGHVSLLLDRAGGVLFTGDAAMSTKSGEIRRGFMNRSTPTFDASLAAIAQVDFQVACFGHSAPLTAGASGAFRRFVDSI